MKEHFITVKDIAEDHDDKEGLIGGSSANFSKHFGLKRVGAHYLKVPSGRRTSRPHAESLEEEFVYVIRGEIDLWFNGKIKKMAAGECIGFPAGTGIGHSFINNSESDVELFVAGDRTKKENQYRFHLEPRLEEDSGVNWWKGMPEQKLGGHNGLPGSFDDSLVDNSIFIFNGPSHLPRDSYSYPGDDETFTNGVCLSRKFDLKSIAIWLERIPVGKRTSWPHAHSVEEEFVYVLKGNPTVWLSEKRLNLITESSVTLKCVSGNSLWNEMCDLRFETEKDFGEFSLSDVGLMIENIKNRVITNSGKWFLCYQKGIAIGEIGYLPVEYDGRVYWRLQDVDILPSFRGKGLGSELLNSVCLLAKSDKVSAICLRADEDDWKKDWYLRYGFDYLCSF